MYKHNLYKSTPTSIWTLVFFPTFKNVNNNIGGIVKIPSKFVTTVNSKPSATLPFACPVNITPEDNVVGTVQNTPSPYEKINNEELLKKYADKAKKSVEKYNGKFLIRGGDKITTEGNDFIRTTIIEFENFLIAKEFFYSKDYQNAYDLLKGTVIRHHQIIEGFNIV